MANRSDLVEPGERDVLDSDSALDEEGEHPVGVAGLHLCGELGMARATA